MDLEETMVEELTDVAVDDTPQEAPVTDESEPLMEEPVDQPEKVTQGTSEPGWIKKRVDKAVEKAVAQTKAEMQALFDAQMAPLKERQLEYDAKDMVEQGLVKDLDTAKELLRYRMGMPSKQPEPKEDPAVSARIKMLQHQADKINERGIDVIAEFNSNPEVKQKVISGEWDFYDVAESMKPGKKPPAPMRSPNGASGSQKSTIASMTDDQFDRLEKKIHEGARYKI